MFVKGIKKVEKAMFPIFRIDQIQPDQSKVIVAGTGFFINEDGFFISVAHVFDNKTPQTKYLFWGFLPNDLKNPPIEIEEITRDDINDIFIGRIKMDNTDFLSLEKKISPIGKTVCVAGYPLATITLNSSGGLELSGVRRYFQPSFVLDYAKANVVATPTLTRTHDGFLVRDFGLFGMSGGPVFDIKGVVVGMQGSVTSPRTSSNGTRSIIVENALAIKTELIIDLIQKNKIALGKKS